MKRRGDAPLEREKCGVKTCWKSKGFAENRVFLGKIENFCIQGANKKSNEVQLPNNPGNFRRKSDDWRNIRGCLLVYTIAAVGAAQVSQRLQEKPRGGSRGAMTRSLSGR
jgi:hypothetical protein